MVSGSRHDDGKDATDDGGGFADHSAISLPDLGEQLGIAPAQFRSYLLEYEDVLRVSQMGAERVLSGNDAARLALIHRLTQAGHTPTQVRAEVGHHGSVSPDYSFHDTSTRKCGTTDETGSDLQGLLYEALDRLEKLEKRRLEDRDKIMLTLIKAQKEIQQLRYSLAAMEGRRRKGLFSRLFGR